jgi:tetratricopeptide (TPR) repeat protein
VTRAPAADALDACLQVDTLAGLADGALDGEAFARVELHLDRCGKCQHDLAALLRLDRPASDAGAADPPVPEVVRPGSRFGRYHVLERLGTGGMGTVWSAYDPDLDRRVALKLLRAGGRAPASLALRLRREAQAMARLSHPNVVAVYDVGTVGDRLFIALELVRGATLREACANAASWRDRLALCLAAGRGLAAAHAAGIVHRDFKPDNVLCGDDGTVKVTDFGLAQTLATQQGDADGAAPLAGTAPATALTQTGLRLGTPAYMSPEQHLGRATDAATDQFSYCVTVYESLYGELPFAGDTPAARADAVLHGRVSPPAGGNAVPARIRTALLRGLSADPADRHPSLAALLAALSADPSRARRRLTAAVAAVAVATGAGVAAARWVSAPGAACAEGSARIATAWGPEQRALAEAAFAASGRADAGAVIERAGRHLDDYAAHWAAMRREACEATRVRGEQSETLLDLRMACLDERRAALAALAGALAEPVTADMIARAVPAAVGLPAVAECADAGALLGGPAPPSDPALRARHDALRERLAAARAYELAGRMALALEHAKAIAADAGAIGLAAVEARALLTRGRLEMVAGGMKEAEASHHAAARAAARAGDDDAAAEAWVALVYVVGFGLGRPDDAAKWARVAESATLRAGDAARHRANLATNLGALAEARADWPEAVRQHEIALAIARDELGAPPIGVGVGQMNYCTVLRQAARHAEAQAACDAALEVLESHLGPEHPYVASVLHALATNLADQGEHAAARAPVERAIAIWGATTGTGTFYAANALQTLATIETAADHEAEALAVAERAIAAYTAAVGPQHPATAHAERTAANALLGLGRPAEALARLERAHATAAAALGPDHASVAPYLLGIGEVQRQLGRHAEAAATLERALAVVEASSGAEAYLGDILTAIGMNRLDTGRAAGAIAPLERAVAALDARPGDPFYAATARFQLGRALYESGRNRGRGIELARQASDEFRAIGDDTRADAAATWARAAGRRTR